jgi:hypothetical protein
LVRVTGVVSFVCSARNTTSVTPVAHPKGGPRQLHHDTGHDRSDPLATSAYSAWCALSEERAGALSVEPERRSTDV